MAKAKSLGEAIFNLFLNMARKGKKLTCSTALWIGLNFSFCPSAKSSLMSEYGISESYMYVLRSKAQEFMDSLKSVEDMGGSFLLMDPDFITRMILLLHCEGKNSTHQIQIILREGMKVDISIGKISEIINTSAHKAIKLNEEMDKRCLPHIKNVGADEIFIGRTPILTALDLVSTYVLLISPQHDRTADTWKTAFAILHDLGLSPETVITDACGSLLSSLTDCFGEEDNVSQLDVFHVLKSLHDAYYQVKRKLSKPMTDLPMPWLHL